jgi:hypothetical protein
MAKVIYDIAITNDMQIGIFTRDTELTSEQAKIVLEQLMSLLGTDEIVVKDIAKVEKHRDDARTQLVHDLTHDHAHQH